MLRKLLAKLIGKNPSRAARTAPKKKSSAKKKKVATRAKQKKSASSKKRSPALGLAKEVGQVVAFFRIPVVAVIRVGRRGLKLGDQIWIRGHTTNLKLTVSSMQINHQPITKAQKGDEVGIQIPSRARKGDRLYQIGS